MIELVSPVALVRMIQLAPSDNVCLTGALSNSPATADVPCYEMLTTLKTGSSIVDTVMSRYEPMRHGAPSDAIANHYFSYESLWHDTIGIGAQ